MRARSPKARGYDVHKKEKHYISSERPHKKPIMENKKHIGMVMMDTH